MDDLVHIISWLFRPSFLERSQILSSKAGCCMFLSPEHLSKGMEHLEPKLQISTFPLALRASRMHLLNLLRFKALVDMVARVHWHCAYFVYDSPEYRIAPLQFEQFRLDSCLPSSRIPRQEPGLWIVLRSGPCILSIFHITLQLLFQNCHFRAR